MAWILKANLGVVTDASATALASDEDSDFAQALRVFPIKDADGTPLEVTEAMVNGDAGWWNIKATNTSGYPIHMSTDTGFAGAGLIGLGADTSNAVALIVSVKANTARGIVITNESTIGSGTDARGLEVNQRSTTSPVAYFSPRVANVAPTFRLSSGGITGAASTVRDVLADHTDGAAGTTAFWQVRLDGQQNFYRPISFGGAADTAVNRNNGITVDYVSSESRIRFNRRASSTPGSETWYTHQIRTSTTELQFGSSATTGLTDGTETFLPIVRMRAEGGVRRIAFLNAAPIPQITWAAATGTKTRTTFVTSTVTLPQLAERVAALIDDLGATSGFGLLSA